MSNGVALRRMTAEEFCEFVHRPENDNRWFELVHGAVIELPRPIRRQGIVCANIGYVLGSQTFRVGKGYVTSNDAGVILQRNPDTVRGPDLAYYEDAATFAEVPPGYAETPPRLAVEVLSPDDRASFMLRKINDYLRNGVEILWVVDPERRSLTIFRPDRGPWSVDENQELTAEEVLPGFHCCVADFFLLPGEAKRQNQSKS